MNTCTLRTPGVLWSVEGRTVQPAKEAPMEQTTTRPTWDEVMAAFRDLDSGMHAAVRTAATMAIEEDHRYYGDEGVFGISSSDISHTIFGTAEWHYRHGLRHGDLVSATLRDLMGRVA